MVRNRLAVLIPLIISISVSSGFAAFNPSGKLSFTENRGQWGDKTLFKAETGRVTFYFCRDEVAYLFVRNTNQIDDRPEFENPKFPERERKPRYKQEAILVKAQFIGANMNAEISGEDHLLYNCNYFYGRNSEGWHTEVPNWSSITYKELWPGVDLKYHGDDHQMKYDFIIQPGADISKIQIHYDGIINLDVTQNGDLEAATTFGPVYEKKPYVYQEINGAKREIAGRYKRIDNNDFGFEIDGEYNPAYTMVIDPGLVYSTYLGGTYNDYGYSIAVDSKGYAYVTGGTRTYDFPICNPYDGNLSGYEDIFVTKFSVTGNELIFSTYIGGSSLDDGEGIAVDEIGNAYIDGITSSVDFPVVNAYDSTGQGTDAFILKLSPRGDFLYYSTFLGGSNADGGWAIAIDNQGNAYATGHTYSTDFPMVNPFDDYLNYGRCDAFIAKLSARGDSLIYSSYLGGDSTEYSIGVAVDNSGCAYFTGYTYSPNFPTANAFDSTFNGESDAFAAKISPAGAPLIYSTYLGGNRRDVGCGIGADSYGYAYVAGWTASASFPLFNPFEDRHRENDAFLTKLSQTGNSLVYSTFLGGSGNDLGFDIKVIPPGDIYITGYSASPDFPVVNPYDGSWNNGADVFVTRFSAMQNYPSYGTYLGGSGLDEGDYIAIDEFGYMYVTGHTYSSDFPVVNAFDSCYNDSAYLSFGDVFVSKLEPPEVTTLGETILPENIFLFSSYPNPFNASANFKFNLPVAGLAEIAIYDILGRKVKEYDKQDWAAGLHIFTWDAFNYPSGLYFARLKVDEHTQSIRLILLK